MIGRCATTLLNECCCFFENKTWFKSETPVCGQLHSLNNFRYLREWDKEANDPFDSSTCVDMNKYCFNDLKVRLGCPYVFLHLGECEHLIVFKDIR